MDKGDPFVADDRRGTELHRRASSAPTRLRRRRLQQLTTDPSAQHGRLTNVICSGRPRRSRRRIGVERGVVVSGQFGSYAGPNMTLIPNVST